MSLNHAYLDQRRQTYPVATPGNTRSISSSLELDEARGSSVEPESCIFYLLKPDLARGSSGEPEIFIFGSLELDLGRESFDEPKLCIYG